MWNTRGRIRGCVRSTFKIERGMGMYDRSFCILFHELHQASWLEADVSPPNCHGIVQPRQKVRRCSHGCKGLPSCEAAKTGS